jgi:23S rRNA (guanosine2251-2'-O)-methyltransferase
MTASFYQIRECENPACGLRYPLTEGHPFGERCPLCLGATRVELQKSLDQEIFSGREAGPTPGAASAQAETQRLEALLDNVRSAWNVGAIFRTADAFGVSRLHLCGVTPTPENVSVSKTALGADKTIPWLAARNGLAAARELKAAGAWLLALEQDERAVAAGDFLMDTRLEAERIVLIVGNEISGVDPGLLDLCDRILYIPMRGRKRSLNVEVAFGIAAQLLSTHLRS